MDNFLPDNRLSSARRIILIGHGPGGQAIMDLLENRSMYVCLLRHKYLFTHAFQAMSVTSTVRAVVQVVGHDKVPIVPKYSDELRVWYTQVRLDTVKQYTKAPLILLAGSTLT